MLHSIPHWITREDYKNPKPSPDGYLEAIKRLAKPGDAIIGFEDSRRGLTALIQAGVHAVLVNNMDAPMLEEFRNRGVPTFSSLEDVLNSQQLAHNTLS